MEKQEIDTWIMRGFKALDTKGNGFLVKSDVLSMLESQGVYHHQALHGLIEELKKKKESEHIEFKEFQILSQGHIFLKRVLERNVIIPMFESFSQNYKRAYEEIKMDSTDEYSWGAIATYIPRLKEANPESFATSFCSTDDQFTSFGNTDVKFSIQSIGKVMAYSYLYDLIGERVHKFVGEEPSGVAFNEPVFDKNGRPHNPMVNAGAIMVCALLRKNGKTIEDLINFYQKSTDTIVKVDMALYKEEKLTGHTNHALTSLMLARRVLPQYESEEKTKEAADQALDLYFMNCSIYVDTQSLARFGAMLANNGIIPSNGQRVLKAPTVQAVVTIMTTCGMYNGAGKFTKDWGVPSKSGVSGGLLTVIPGIGSFATYSPKLNAEGNTVRGIGIIQKLSSVYSNFNLFHKDLQKKDCARKPYQTAIQTVITACSAASTGDLEELNRLYVMGVSLEEGDYDKRTPLHLSASSGHLDIVNFLIKCGVSKNPKDRWGATPLDDAKNKDVYDFLKSQGATNGVAQASNHEVIKVENVSDDDYRLFYAAFYNEVSLMISLQVQGWKVNAFDYDGRTALGIAASEGHIEAVKYLVIHGANIFHKDIKGNNALDDAQREGRKEVIEYLLSVLQNARL